MSEERIMRLERIVERLVATLLRQGTDLDGNWGWPSTQDALTEIKQDLAAMRGDSAKQIQE